MVESVPYSERYSYLVREEDGLWFIDAYQYGSHSHTIDTSFDSKEQADDICKIIQEECNESFTEGQISTI